MNPDTLLHRIIKPDWWIQADLVSCQAFRPAPQDGNLLSVYDGDQIAPEAAYNHYAGDPDKPSPSGVLSVTVEECEFQHLPVIPDPITFPEHVLIDFRNSSRNQIRGKSAALRDAAAVRGWLFRP